MPITQRTPRTALPVAGHGTCIFPVLRSYIQESPLTFLSHTHIPSVAGSPINRTITVYFPVQTPLPPDSCHVGPSLRHRLAGPLLGHLPCASQTCPCPVATGCPDLQSSPKTYVSPLPQPPAACRLTRQVTSFFKR